MRKFLSFVLLGILCSMGNYVWGETETVCWKVSSTGPSVGTAFQVKNQSNENVLQIAFGSMDSNKSDKDATVYTTGTASVTISYNTIDYSFSNYANQ